MADDETAPGIAEPADLYILPLDRFTAARDELADHLRKQGDAEAAAAVARLRKPSIAAWALNRAARNTPDLVARLIASHAELREADSMEKMQVASEKRRQAIAALEEAAVAHLDGGGRGATAQTRERIGRTLLAVATVPEGEADLRAGTLARELEPSGEGWGHIGLGPAPSTGPERKMLVTAERARARAERLEGEAADAERQLEIAKRALAEAKRRAKQARSRADEAATEARLAEEAAADGRD